MSENTEDLNVRAADAEAEPVKGVRQSDTLDDALTQNHPTEEQGDNLLELPPEKLAGMVRDKRKAEASVRSKLREAESERDQLASSVTGFRRQAFAEAAKDSKMHESALEDVLASVNLEDVLGDDGTVDPGKVGEALKGLRQSHPHYFERGPRVSSIGQGGHPSGDGLSPSWSDVLHQ